MERHGFVYSVHMAQTNAEASCPARSTPPRQPVTLECQEPHTSESSQPLNSQQHHLYSLSNNMAAYPAENELL